MTDQPETSGPQGPGFSRAEKTALVAVGVNLGLTVFKFILAWWSGSLALKVEAFHSFADIGSSLAVFMAVLSEMSRKRDRTEGAGLFANPQRMVAVFIGVFLLAVGALFLRKVIAPDPVTVSHPVPVALLMLGMALLSFLLSRFERAVGEKEDSTALTADSFHARVDMFGSLVVAGALIGEGLGWKLDRLAAGLLAAFILTQAINVFGAVIRDMAKKEQRPDLIYREWLWLAIQKRLPGIVPALVTLTTRMLGRAPESKSDRRHAGALLVTGIAVLVLAGYAASGFFTVQANERAVVEHLGRPLNRDYPLEPGLHWSWPWPFDRVRKVDVTTIRRLNVGSAVAPDRRVVLWTNQHYIEQFNLLTGENTFVDVGVVLHYRVADAAAWLYNTQDPETLLAGVTSSVLTQEFSHRGLLATITAGRDELEAALTDRVRDELELYRPGLELISLQVRDAHPPTIVAGDFENVVSATIEYETRINEARGYHNDLIPRARGQAAVNLLAAKAESVAAKNRAAGDVQRFNSVWLAYGLAPQVTRARLIIETAEAVLPGREKIIVPEQAFSGDLELLLTADPGREPGSK